MPFVRVKLMNTISLVFALICKSCVNIYGKGIAASCLRMLSVLLNKFHCRGLELGVSVNEEVCLNN